MNTSEAPYSVLITGLGGQGVLLLSKVIAAVAVEQFTFACRTESRGLSQRGGSVCSDVRFGETAIAPVIGPDSADLIIALDLLEGVRAKSTLKPGGKIVCNARLIPPLHLASKWAAKGPSSCDESDMCNLLTTSLGSVPGTHLIDAAEIEKTSSFSGGINALLLGFASVFLPLSCERLRLTLGMAVKQSLRGAAETAFDCGRAAADRTLSNTSRLSA